MLDVNFRGITLLIGLYIVVLAVVAITFESGGQSSIEDLHTLPASKWTNEVCANTNVTCDIVDMNDDGLDDVIIYTQPNH